MSGEMKTHAERVARQAELAQLPPAELGAMYARNAHAVQSAVALRLGRGGVDGSPKHLRAGLDLSKAEFGGLAVLLVAKGIITDKEYLAAIVEGTEDEVRREEDRASKEFGRPVSFG